MPSLETGGGSAPNMLDGVSYCGIIDFTQGRKRRFIRCEAILSMTQPA